MDSLLQQMILLKDSTFNVISGPVVDGIVWSNLIADMLLRQVLASEKYAKAIVISFDRSADELRSSLIHDRNLTEKLILIDAAGVLCGRRSLESVLNEVELALQIDRNLLNEDEETPAVALLVCSCSALELAIGSTQTALFLQLLHKKLTVNASAPTSSCAVSEGDVVSTEAYLRDTTSAKQQELSASSPSSTMNTAANYGGIILAIVHENLHSTWNIATSYRSTANTYVTCVPNKGQLSPVVALEVHTVRRTHAGRVQEAHELFALPAERGMNKWEIAELRSIPKKDPNNNHDGKKDTQSTMNEIESVFGNTSKLGLISEDISTTSSYTEEGKSESNIQEGGVPQNASFKAQQQRLITFASTDPEFDEDSDPDADLDL